MGRSREQLIRSAVKRAGLPTPFADALLAECPWLDCTSAVSEDLAPQLFSEQAAASSLSSAEVERFCTQYNKLVSAELDPHRHQRNQAYVAISTALSPFGRSGVAEGSDFWLVDDSFSTSTPSLVLIGGYRLPSQAITALRDELSRFSGVIVELRITNEEGDELLTLRQQ
jgi:hypothetical protein